MFKKYYSHGIEYFTKWRLLSVAQIQTLASLNSKDNNFYSIHNYYPDGTKSCPALYFDLDGPTAKEDVKRLVKEIKAELGCTPEVWNSGFKGYHVLVNYEVRHTKCEKVAKYICSKFNVGNSWDSCVYSTKRLWRMPDTYNPKGKKNKVKVLDYDSTYLKKEVLDDYIQMAIEEIESQPVKTYYSEEKDSKNWRSDAPPCILSILEELPPLGQRHNCRVILARFFRASGLSLEQSLVETLKYKHWLEREDKIVQVFESIFNSENPPRFGCRNEDILKEKCAVYCQYFLGE